MIPRTVYCSGGSRRGQFGATAQHLWRSVEVAPLWYKCVPFWCLLK